MSEQSTQELIFLENEYDVLEKKLMELDSENAIFHRLSTFIFEAYNCTYVFYYNDVFAKQGNLLYFIEQKENGADVAALVEERRAAKASNTSIMLHMNGGFSVPFKFPDSSDGYIFIGPQMSGMMYDFPRLRNMVAVTRTLSKNLLYLDSLKSRIERDRLRYAFSKYVSPDIVSSIVQNHEQVDVGGKDEILSVIFTDLRGFTTLSDNIPAEKLVLILNSYLNEMSQVILSLGGTIDKYEGDAIMAFFGAPIPMKDHAIRCCLSALRMKKMEEIINDRLISEGLIEEPLFTRIGINTGSMIVGNIGSAKRLDYTIIGSNVNIASRIENANKSYGTSILVSEYTYNEIKDYFECRYVDEAALKGVHHKIKLYELVSERPFAIPNYINYIQDNFADADSIEEEIEAVDEADPLDDIDPDSKSGNS